MTETEKLARIHWLAKSWRAVPDYDVTPAQDPRKPSDMDIAYDDAAVQILAILDATPKPSDSICQYIQGEYGEELPITRSIVSRTLGAQLTQLDEATFEAMIYGIVGYYTGCLNPDGTSRVGRGYEPT